MDGASPLQPPYPTAVSASDPTHRFLSFNTTLDGAPAAESGPLSATSLTPAELTVAAAAAVLISITTIVGNLFVLVAFRLERQLQTANNCILLSLAIADVGLGLISIPLHATYWIMDGWHLGSVACQVWLCFDYSFTNASVAHLLIICLDRFLSVHSPLTYLSRRTRRRAAVVSALAWAIPFSIWTPLILTGSRGSSSATVVPPDKCYVEILHSSKAASVITCMLEFFIPMAVILALYLKIYLIVRKRNSEKQSLHECSSTLDTKLLARAQQDKHRGLCQQQQQQYSALDGIGNQSPTSRDSEDYSSTDRSGGVFRNIIISIRASTAFKSKSAGDRSDAKAARTLSAILLAFLITWTPYEVFTVVIAFAGADVIPRIVYESGFAMVYLNSTINPICYALGNANFRKAFLKILTGKYRRAGGRRRFSVTSQRTTAPLSFTTRTISAMPSRFRSTNVSIFSSLRRVSRTLDKGVPVKQLFSQEQHVIC